MTHSDFDRESMLELIGLIKDIPTLPDRFLRIQHVIEDSASSVADLIETIHTDQATCTMILKVANSTARNPSGRTISTLSQAISLLGRKEVGYISLSMSLMYGFALPMGMAHVRAFWVHAFGTAMITEFLARRVDPGGTRINDKVAFMAGLLHDIGRAVIGLRVDISYFESQLIQLHGDELIAAEQQSYGIDHAKVGAYTLALWNFPPELVDAVAGHHQADSDNILAQMIRIACRLTHEHIPYDLQIEAVPAFLQTMLPEAITPELIVELALVGTADSSHGTPVNA